MTTENEKLHFYIDDTGIPYEEDQRPRPRTQEDDDFDVLLFKELGIPMKTEEDD